MKQFVLFLVLGWVLPVSAQSTVNLTVTCEGEPLCYWDITLKQGDVVVGNGKTDDKGVARINNVRLAYSTIDIYGDKDMPNGHKDWNVRGYVDVDQQGNAELEFKPFLEEMGIPVATAVAAWGLNEGDCGGGSSTSSSSSTTTAKESTSTQSTETTTSDAGSTTETKESTEETTKAPEPVKLMTPQESLEGQKTMHENKIAKSNSKIAKLKRELDDETPGTKEHNDLLYDIRFEEIDKEISENKLEKVELMIANNYSPIPRSQKGPIDDRIDALKDEEKDLKEKQKDDIVFGTDDEKLSAGSEVSAITEEDLANMSGLDLRRAKISTSSSVGKAKMKLKTRKAFLSPEEQTALEGEIATLEKNLEILDAEIERREAEKEKEE